MEIDGVAVGRREIPLPKSRADPWAMWQGKVRRLDARWWPLWVVLGFIALVIAVSIGLCAAVLLVAWRMVAGLANGFGNLLSPSRELHRR